MTFEKLIRLGGTAAISSGIADIIGIFILFIALYVSAIPGIASGVFLMAGNVLLAFALMGIYGCQFEKTGYLGLTGFVFALSGLLLGMARFFSPLGWGLYLIGILMLVVANYESKIIPSTGLWLWFAGVAISLGMGIAGMKILSYLGTLISGAARTWIGMSLRRKIEKT
jgi:hypothetical protein